MPNIVNQSFFVGELELPNLNNSAELERLTTVINRVEPDCLLKIMGYPLYKLFGSESSGRMTDLLSGAEYTDSYGVLQKWPGIKHDTIISLIANYVYFKYLELKKASLSGTGTSISKPEAGAAYSPGDKMAIAWNFFSEEVRKMSDFLWNKKDYTGARVYPEFTWYQLSETLRVSRKIDSVFEL